MIIEKHTRFKTKSKANRNFFQTGMIDIQTPSTILTKLNNTHTYKNT